MGNDSLLMDLFYLSPSLDFAQPSDESVPTGAELVQEILIIVKQSI
jgi:hypothetical protein